MEHGQVRAILGRHARAEDPGRPGDPAALLPASTLRRTLEAMPEGGQRATGRAYAELWSRTFRTLVSHLRGRPERAITLFAEEVYPFLRGDRRAARVERTGPREVRILLAADLPDAYQCGILEGFVALSGATAIARAEGAGAFTVAYRVAPSDRLARAAQTLAALRLPLLACAALAAVTGVALAAAQVHVDPARALLVVLGALAAQAGASALVDLRSTRPGGPLRPAAVSRNGLLIQAVLGSAVAVAAGLGLALATPVVLLFAAAGLVAGLLLPRLLGRGFGPVAAVLLYGPLIGLGAMHAFPIGANHFLHAELGIVTLPLGFLAAAYLFLGDLADRPLDEAGGRRTLAVSLPRRSQAVVFAAFLGAGLAILAAVGMLGGWPPVLLIAAALAIPAAFVALRVSRDLDDPHSLAPARLATLALALAVGLTVSVTVLTAAHRPVLPAWGLP